jgi:hypothetical protein
MFTKCLALATSLLIVSAVASAHHSVAMFDLTREITVQGTVKDWQWTNPHAWLQVLVPDATGAEVEHGFELGSPNTLVRGGFRRDSFKPGDKVKVIAAPRRDGTVGGLYLCGRTAEGKWLVFGMGSDTPARPECND